MKVSFKMALVGASLAIISTAALAKNKIIEREYRPLSEKGAAIVASRTYKGKEIIGQMLTRVKDVDTGYLQHIDFFKGMLNCKEFDDTIMSYTPNSKVETRYQTAPSRKAEGKGAPDTCSLTTKAVSKTIDFTVKCELTMKEAQIIAREAIYNFEDAIDRFRKDGLYSNISPSATLDELQQSERCEMMINAKDFE